MNSKFKKKFFYLIFSIFKKLLKGPFVLDFGKFKLNAYPQRYDYTRFMLTRVDVPDALERKIIKNNLLNKKNIFIDCGANAGFYSIDIAKSVTNCNVYAFEPSIKERYFLKENIKLNKIKNIEVLDFAVGNRVGEVYFNDTRSSLKPNSSGSGYITNNAPEIKKNYPVKITTLDDFFKNKLDFKNTSIFIKIDLEGLDLEAIEGSKELLINYDCSVVFEFSKMIIKNHKPSLKIIDFLLEKNFKLSDMHGLNLSLKDLLKRIEDLDDDHDTCGNYFLSKKKLLFN
jgi:FkbM family methyltransferase